MPYATQADLVSRFGETEIIQISDRSNTGAIDAGVVADKLADADAEVDAYLAQRFTLPLPSVPPVLKRIACDIARYHLYDNRSTEDVTRRYNDAINFLKAVAKGTVSIGIDPNGNTPPASSDTPIVEADPPMFSRDNLRDFSA